MSPAHIEGSEAMPGRPVFAGPVSPRTARIQTLAVSVEPDGSAARWTAFGRQLEYRVLGSFADERGFRIGGPEVEVGPSDLDILYVSTQHRPATAENMTRTVRPYNGL